MKLFSTAVTFLLIFIKSTQQRDPGECGEPPSVKNALISGGMQPRYEVGEKVVYACESGFVREGSAIFSKCLPSDDASSLHWTEPGITCRPRSCGDPGYVAHARRMGYDFTFPNKISFECEDGYALRGNGTRHCQANATWSGNLPTCEPIFCFPPTNPANGKVSYSSLGFESELHYECDLGFNLENGQGRKCSSNGTWSGNEPACLEARCESPVAPEHGTVAVIDKSSMGRLALYNCDEGRVLLGSSFARCSDTGRWTSPSPRCLALFCDPPTNPANGKVSYSSLRFESELHYECEPGFMLNNNDGRKCSSNGTWSGNEPVCLAGTVRLNNEIASLENAGKSTPRSTGILPTTRQPLIAPTHAQLVPVSSCSCIYPLTDSDVVAHVGRKRLSYGSEVKINETVKFHCLRFGYSRLNGMSQLNCENCRPWKSFEFPKCVAPQKGDALLQFEGDFTILPGGLVGVEDGGQLSIRCDSNEIQDYPIWASSFPRNLSYQSYKANPVHFVSVLNLTKVDSQFNGPYQCNVKGYGEFSFTIQVIYSCGGVIEDTNGTIKSPLFPDLYPSNQVCIWEIIAPPQHSIILNFTHFDLEEDEDCADDSVEIRSKLRTNETRKHGVFCGSRLPPVMTSEENSLIIEFSSDYSVQKTGFRALFSTDKDECATNNGGCQHICQNTIGSYACTCRYGFALHGNNHDCTEDYCSHEIKTPLGEFSSPNFPDNYPKRKNCLWLFTTTPGHRIKLVFHEFELEHHDGCSYDQISAYDGQDKEAYPLGRFCGSKIPLPILSSGNKMYLAFRSDPSVQKKGFRATHTTVCGGRLLARNETQHLYSHVHFGHQMYGNKEDCEWIVQGPNNRRVRLQFLTFEVEHQQDCDYVEVYDGETDSTPNLGKFCGNKVPNVFLSSGDTLMVRFRSDLTISTKGFSAAYKAFDAPP